MLYKNLLSNTCSAVSVLTLSGILLGTSLIPSSWAMDQKDLTPLNERPVAGVVINRVLTEDVLVGHIINNPVMKWKDRQAMASVARHFSVLLNCKGTLPFKGMMIASVERLERLISCTQPLPHHSLVAYLCMYGHGNMNQIPYSFKNIFQILPCLPSLVLQDFSLEHLDDTNLIEAICGCTNLRALEVMTDDTRGDLGVAVLAPVVATHPALETLRLNCGIGDKGAQAIADALLKNSTLTELNLRLNKIGQRGVEAIAVALSQNHTLKTLNLCNNWVDNKGVEALLRRDDNGNPRIHLERLDISNNRAISIADDFKEQIQKEYAEDGIEVIF